MKIIITAILACTLVACVKPKPERIYTKDAWSCKETCCAGDDLSEWEPVKVIDAKTTVIELPVLEASRKEHQKLQNETGSGTVIGIQLPKEGAFEEGRQILVCSSGVMEWRAAPTTDEVAAFEPVTPEEPIVFSQNGVLAVDPHYITKADAEEIVMALNMARKYTDALIIAWEPFSYDKGPLRELKGRGMNSVIDGQKALDVTLSKWRKRLEELK